MPDTDAALLVSAQDGGAAFAVRVTPRAARDQIEGAAAGALKVRLTAPPVEGAANAALVKLVAKALAVSPSRVRVVSGQHGRSKRLFVDGLAPDQVRQRLGC
ncbi:MAG: DUF167 domain-containing protein [Pseudomonadota bacterium]